MTAKTTAKKTTTKTTATEPTPAPVKRVKTPLVWTYKTDAKGDDIYRINGKVVFAVCHGRNGQASIYIHGRLGSKLGVANREGSQYTRRLRGPKDEVFHIVNQAASEWANKYLVEYVEE